jgi:hypothetical protein
LSKETGTKTSASADAIVTSPMVDVRATSLFHALSEIEQFSAAELRTDLPEGVVPLLPKFSFMDVGFKNGTVTTAVTFFLAPFSMAAIEHLIPVFGDNNPSLLDKLFVYAFASAPAWAMAMLIAFISMKTYRGRITKTLINNLLFSYATAKISVSIFLMAIGYFIYSRVFTADLISNSMTTLKTVVEFISASVNNNFTSDKIYYFLLDFRKIIIKAVNFAALLHVGTAVMLLISHIIGVQKTRQIELLRKEWE